MLDKLAKMSARQIMVSLYGRPPAYGERPRWLQGIAKQIGISGRMARSLWNEEIKNPEHWAIKKMKQEAQIAEARKEATALAKQYELIAGGLRTSNDENLYSKEIDRLERLVRIIGGLDSSRT